MRPTTLDIILDGRFESLVSQCNDDGDDFEFDLQPFLPYFLRISDGSRKQFPFSKKLICNYPQVNQILAYMRLDYSSICASLETHLSTIRRRLYSSPLSPFNTTPEAGTTDENISITFENSSVDKRAKLVLTELLELVEYNQFLSSPQSAQSPPPPPSELLKNETYTKENSIIIGVSLARCCSLFSIPDVVRSLISLKTSRILIQSIVANYPANFHDIVGSLVAASTRFPHITQLILRDICDLTPYSALHVRSLLVRQQILPSLALHIAIKQADQTEFLSSLLDEHLWIKDYIKDTQSDPNSPIYTLRKHLIQNLRENAREPLTIAKRLQIASLLRLFCGLIGLMGLRLDSQELGICLSIFTPEVLSHSSSFRIVKLGLCFLLICPDLVKNAEKSVVSECLSNILKSGHCSEMLLLTAIHFHTNQPLSVVELVRNALGLFVSIHIESLKNIGQLITGELLTEDKVAREANSLEIIPSLSTTSSSTYSITCVFHLLKGGIFSKHEVDVSQWILKQIEKAEEPIHHLMPSLIEALVDCTQTGNGFRMKRFQEMTIKSVFTTTSETSCKAPQILILYYVLVFNDRLFQRSQQKKSSSWDDREYSMNLLDSLPIKSLLSHAQNNPALYANIYPPLLNYVVTQFPQLFTLLNLLIEEEQIWSISSDKLSKSVGINLFKQELQAANKKPNIVISALQRISDLSPAECWPYAESLITVLLPQLLSESVDNRIMLLFADLWEKLNSALPSDFALMTFNKLRSKEGRMVFHNDLVSDPMMILRFDPHVLEKPPLFKILLHILNMYITASRKSLQNSAQLGSANREEVVTLILTQDTTIIQVLLELCLPKPDSTGRHEDIKILICTFIHQLYIENPILIKLVHFQGYPLELLPVTVHGIASMHTCLDFIPELIVQPQVEKRVFGVHLAAHIIEKYPIPKSLNVAKAVLAQIKNAKSLSSDASTFLMQTLRALVHVCAAFPLLTEEAIEILLEMTPGSTLYNTIGLSDKFASLSSEIVSVYDALVNKVITKSA